MSAPKKPRKPGPKPGTPRKPHDRATCECGPCRRWRKTQAARAEGRRDGRSTKTVRVALELASWAETVGGVDAVLRQAKQASE